MAQLSPAQLQAMREDKHDVRANLYASIIVSVLLAYAAVTLRMVARWRSRTKLRADDWLILAGLVTATGFIIASLFMVHYGLGLNVVRVMDAGHMQPFVESVVTAQVLYSCSIVPVKISILCLYHRLFPSQTLKKVSIATGTFIACYAAAQAVCFVLQCIPLSVMWTGDLGSGRCIDLNAMLTTMSVLNVSTDFILVGLPVPYLLKLRIDNTRKLQLIGTFLIGGIVCVFGILRSVFVGTADPGNPSRSYAQGAMWSVLEVCVGIVSACLPTLRPLFRARATKGASGSNSRSVHFSNHGPAKDYHPGAIPMSTKLKSPKPGTAFKSDDRHPFAKLDDSECGEAGGIDALGSRAASSAAVRHHDGRPRSSSSSSIGKSPNGRNLGRGIVVTTDIRIHDHSVPSP